MNTNTYKVISAALLAYSSLAAVCTAGGPGSTGGELLNLGEGPRELALAGAPGALPGNPTGADLNPAGINGAGRQLSGMFYKLPVGTSLGKLTIIHPVGRATVGISGTFLQHEPIQATNQQGDSIGKIEPGDQLVALTAATELLPELAIGVTAKHLRSQLTTDAKASATAFDAGAILILSNKVAAGLSAANFGSAGLKYDSETAPLPTKYRANLLLMAGKTLLSAGAETGKAGTMLSVGGEYELGPLALRVGFCKNPDLAGPGLTTGVGFKVAAMQLDYAFIPLGDLGATHRLALGIKY